MNFLRCDAQNPSSLLSLEISLSLVEGFWRRQENSGGSSSTREKGERESEIVAVPYVYKWEEVESGERGSLP